MKTSISYKFITHRLRRGFTLIELTIVVVIIGILAALATYSVTQYIRYSKTAEAREIVGSIMAGQDAYHSEVGRYLDVTGGLAAGNFYPVKADFNGSVAVMWGAADACVGQGGATCLANFNSLGVNVNSAVLFRYASTTFPVGALPIEVDTRAPNYNPDGVTSPRAGYVVMAVSDLDGSADGNDTVLVGSNLNARIHIENSGQ